MGMTLFVIFPFTRLVHITGWIWNSHLLKTPPTNRTSPLVSSGFISSLPDQYQLLIRRSSQASSMNELQLLRYSRHLLLNEFEYDFQEKLNQATALVIGCGGLTNACLPILAGAGVGHLVLCDDDLIELSNLPRQLGFSEADIGQAKVFSLEKYLTARNTTIQITAFKQQADADFLVKQIQHCDVIIDCTDNAKTRQLINQTAVHSKTPLVSASVIQFSGQVMVFDPTTRSLPLLCLYLS